MTSFSHAISFSCTPGCCWEGVTSQRQPGGAVLCEKGQAWEANNGHDHRHNRVDAEKTRSRCSITRQARFFGEMLGGMAIKLISDRRRALG